MNDARAASAQDRDKAGMIRCLVPDLPDAGELRPWLERIDQNRWYTNFGPLACEFEQRLLGFIEGASDASCVALASGMAALEIGLRALGIGPGMKVLVPALTFPATALAVARCGAVPVLIDVCPQRWMLTPEIARQCLAHQKLDLIMPVAAFGVPISGEDWDRFVAETNVPVLADAAAALGAQVLGSRVHWAFSLHATKPMGIGEGGLFVSHDAVVTRRVARLANFGFDHRVIVPDGGTNAKLSEYAAAVGLAQLERWPALQARRSAVHRQYCEQLVKLPDVQMQSGRAKPPATLCVQLPADAATIADELTRAGIETRRWYLPPLYEHPAFRDVLRIGADGAARLPVTEHLAITLLGLPFHTRLTSGEIAQVVQALARALDLYRAAGHARLVVA